MAIHPISTEQHYQRLHDLFWEYLSWANERNAEHLGIRLDIHALHAADMADLGKYVPPQGLLLAALEDTVIAGCICLRTLNESTGELKRLYVRPAHRKRGIGSALIAAAVEHARITGFRMLRLDSARYMTAAQALYRRVGFSVIEPYPESEIPPEYHQFWVFMELPLDRHPGPSPHDANP
ncbi:MAG: GNAT family N-acetyltransferase [Chloroflexi bacterium]|nr:GNAT family N-acetyltransferase [Chloroflexota bacterium]